MLELNKISLLTNLKNEPFLGMHGNKSFSWEFNAPSYLSIKNGNSPVSILKLKVSLDSIKFNKFINQEGFRLLTSSEEIVLNNDLEKKDMMRYIRLNKPSKKDHIVISMVTSAHISENDDIVIMSLSNGYGDGNGKFYSSISDIEISYTKPELNSKAEELIKKMMQSSYVKEPNEFEENTPIVGIVCSTNDGLEIKKYDVSKTSKKMSDEDLDAHYGDNFSNFHKSIVNILKSDDKGLIIFHGTPGTGKTQYIRLLIAELASEDKSIIYIPSSFVDMFMEPSFISFLNEWIIDQGHATIILLEDAESLVESRDSGVRSQGISNLLNATDGILNDILGTQIILTFNTDLEFIDSALLRPERLLARKEFTSFDVEQAKKLIDYLKIEDLEPKDGMSVAEIYAHKNKRSILEHNIRKPKGRIGF